MWCASGGRLLAFEANGAPRLDLPFPGVHSLGASGSRLAAILDDGLIVWLDLRSGREVGRLPIGRTAVLVSGGGAMWAIDEASGEGMRLGEPGRLIARVPMPGLDCAAADGERVWWLSRLDTKLRDGTREVDLGIRPGERGGFTVCANSAWLSVERGLVRVGTWSAMKGPLVPASVGQLPFLTCGGGVLVGASNTDVVVLDPSADADVRRLDINPDGDVGMLVATRTMAWVFSRQHSKAWLVRFRVG
ncbi:MAG: hypothetical protein NTNFB02_22990 [Nitrospira sp.]